jgi:F-type H+-transporting ATPase subunit epsilon
VSHTFHCTLVTPERKLVDEEVTYASVPAWDGLIGVAPSRAPMLIKLGDGPLRLDFTQGGSRYFFLGGGFAQMKDNRLSLLTSEAMPAQDIVKSNAETDLKAANDRKARAEAELDKKERQQNRARQLIHVCEKFGNRT